MSLRSIWMSSILLIGTFLFSFVYKHRVMSLWKLSNVKSLSTNNSIRRFTSINKWSAAKLLIDRRDSERHLDEKHNESINNMNMSWNQLSSEREKEKNSLLIRLDSRSILISVFKQFSGTWKTDREWEKKEKKRKEETQKMKTLIISFHSFFSWNKLI